MTLTDLQHELRTRNIQLREEDGQLAFSAPKGALTPALREAIREHKPALLELLRRPRVGSPPPLRPRPASDAPLPLSSAQQRLWFMQQLGDPAAYNVPSAWRIRGPLDRAALAAALTQIVQRHESLRTVFVEDDGRACQVIQPARPVPVPVHDLRERSPADRRAELQRRCDDAALRPFDLSRDLMLRAALLECAADEHVLLLTVHHIAVDGLSLGQVFAELSALYSALVRGQPSPLAALEHQYADFTVWQRTWLDGQVRAAQRDWWQRHLAGAPALLALPTDHPRPALQSSRGGAVEFHVAPATTEALRALARSARATLFMTLLAAFDVLLARHSGQDDVVVGVTTSGRSDPALAPLIGNFAAVMAVRADLSHNPTFLELLARVRGVLQDAYEIADFPLEDIVQALQLERTSAHSPLFQALLVLQSGPPLGLELAGLAVALERLPVRTTRFDLTLDLTEVDGGLVGVCSYNADLFEASTIARMMDRFVALLAAIAADPVQRIEAIPLLTAAERDDLLTRWNATAADVPSQDVHALFLAQARRTSDAPAAVLLAADDSTPTALTYAELAERAARLADHLRTRGVGRGTRVGICMERSLDLVVALLAVLASGAAYVPFEPSYPPERLAFMHADAGVGLILAHAALAPRLPGDAAIFAVDAAWPSAGPPAPPADVRPGDLAYVMYTSGSTGRPKGVMIEQRGLANYLAFAVSEYAAAAGDGALVCSSLGFDLTITSLLAPLLAGAAVFLLPPGDELPLLAAELARGRRRYSFLKLTPSHLAALAPMVPAARLAAAARVLVLGGEQLTYEALAALRAGPGAPCIVNEYGPTETVVGCCVHTIAADEHGRGAVPIGHAIANTRLYVLDRHRQPVPLGVAGELYIGGVQVARGYWNRPDLDADRFVADPFVAGARLYRTGDLARRRPDGALEFLGRVDRQVKLHGFRIELGEIEEVIRSEPGVANVAVVLRSDDARERLVAYLAPAAPQGTDAIQARLAARLPAYMMPAAFVELDALPLTAHGKVDLAALPAPETRAPAPAAAPPTTPTETRLAAIVAEVLGLDAVGVDDRFFSLGGDSLTSVQVVARARRAGLHLELTQIFQHQTVRALARCADEAAATAEPAATNLAAAAPVSATATRSAPSTAEAAPTTLVARSAPSTAEAALSAPFAAISADDRARLSPGVEDAYPPAAVQLAMLFFSGLDAQAHTYHNVSSHHLRLHYDEVAWRRALADVLARHPVLRASFDLSRFSEPLVLVHAAVVPPLTVHDWRARPSAAADFSAWLAAEQQAPFVWDEPPLLRVHLHRTGDDTCRLTLVFHHALLDGWSLAVVVTELLQRYAAHVRGEAPPLPPLAATHRDFVVLERAAVADPAARQFWTDALADAPALTLPRWPASTRAQDRGPGLLNVPVPAALSAGLVALAAAAEVSPKSVLLAAHARVLGRLTNQREVVLGLTAHGRPETAEVDQLVGNFLNLLPVRLDVHAGTWLSLCRAAHEAEHRGLAFRHFPLAEIQRHAGRKPLFETALNYTHFHVGRRLGDVHELEVLALEEVAPGEMTLQANFSLDPTSGAIRFQLTYDPDALCKSQVEAIAGYHLRTFAAMIADPYADHARVSMLSDAERHQVLVGWNGPVTEVGDRPFVHRQIAAQAAARPDVVAVTSVDPTATPLTFRELDAHSNRLAHHLRALGLGPGKVIGLFVERSPHLVVALLAALKSGAAYVPLDPQSPPARLAELIAQTRPDVVLHTGRQPALPDGPRALSLDDDAPAIAAQPATDPAVPVVASDLAYVLFTSGSTGTPKGAQIDHGNLAAFMASAREAYGITADDRVLQFASLNFDTSIEEIYLTLMQGGTLVLRDDDMVSSPERFIAACRRLDVTAIHLPTAYWHMLTAELVQKQLHLPPAVRVVFIGGEAALPQRVKAWHHHCGDTPALINTYGTTETTAVISIFSLGTWAERGREAPTFPVGRPLPTVQAYVLDHHGEPVPTGTPGELFIGGPQVGPGYWQLPELAAERYLANPFGPGRIYRSGDLVRWLPDGVLECCGRLDQQVKIRGYRVEPGEVESALSMHPDVRAAAVLVREARPGDRRLVAYVAVRQDAGEPTSAAALRTYLLQKLPEYAVPAEIAVLAALPLTVHGKLDRRALEQLPAPARADVDADSPYVAPRTATEARLSEIFAAVLGLPRVGVDDDFFALGGSSLVAMQISSRIHGVFAVDIPFRPILECPSVAALAAHIDDLSVRSGNSATAIRPIPAEQRQGPLPVSYAQQRMWLLDQLGQGAAYNLACHIVLTGELDVSALQRALQAIVDRHEVLRSVFVSVGAEVRQLVAPAAVVTLPRIDLGDLPPAEQAVEVGRLHAAEAQRPFELDRDLPLRCALLRLSAAEHRLFCTIHHIAGDAWSLALFQDELTTLYAAFAADRPSPLAPLALQYADFAAWQRARDLGPSLAFWRETLRAPLPALELPIDHPRPTVPDTRGATLIGRVPAAVIAALRDLGRRQASTLFMVLAAAFNLLLHRYTGADDLVIGVPAVGRDAPATARMLGFFIDTVVLRTDLTAPEGGPLTFRALVGRVRAALLAAFAHQDAPFDKLVEVLQPDRRPGRDPIYEVMLNLISVPTAQAQAPGLEFAALDEEDTPARRSLTLYMRDLPDGLELSLTYQSALFAPERMTALLDQFSHLLEQVAARPDAPVEEFSLVTPSTRARLPDLRTPLPRPAQVPITQCLAEWAARTPDRPAVEAAGRVVTYAELLRDAERIARSLLARGLAAGDVVAVHGVRCYGVIAAMFGALLGGGVMLTVDATLPAERQRVMLDEANTRFVLNVQGDEGTTVADHLARDGRTIAIVDATSGGIDVALGDGIRLPVLSGDAPAYVMFTSGTTGKPKGMLGVHRGVAHFLAWQRQTFEIGPGDRCAQFAGLSFELILRDVFLAPTSGATLCLPPYRLEFDPPRLLAWLEQAKITLVHPVPSLASAWIDHVPPGFRGTALRWTLFLGEPLTDALVRRWRAIFPATQVVNFYGPSETTMAKCCYRVPAEPPPGVQPVGYPLPQTQAFVFDAHGRLCGIGEPGQIVLRTPFRTLGYINDPEGQRRFVVNPERDDPEDWLYFSGDRGRYRPDGSLDILGRVDDQVKVRGIRVEPAEIKAVLDQHSAVGGSAVIATDEDGEMRLVAYVCPRAGQSLDLKELRRYLGQRLPGGLVPSYIVPLAAIPVTSNGKLDRGGLPRPTAHVSDVFGVPRDEQERALVELWQDVLGLPAVGIHDNFFELGGHSLLAVHLMARIEQRFGQRLSLAVLFESPTVATLAGRLDHMSEETWSPLVAIQPRGSGPPLFCAPGVGGNVLYLYALARKLGKEQPFYGLQAVGLDGVTPPHTSIEAMAADYITQIRRVRPAGPYLLAGHSFGGRVAFEMAQQLLAAGEDVPFVTLIDCSPPFSDEAFTDRDEADMLEEMAAILGLMAGKAVALRAAELRPLDPDARLRRLLATVKEAGLLPAGAREEHVRGWLAVFKGNYQCGLTYRKRPVRPVPLVYYCAAEHPPEFAAKRIDGWREVGPVEVIVVPGSHLGMMSEPHVTALAVELAGRFSPRPSM